MEEKVRLYIRKFLFESFYQEADVSPHYTERLNTRMKNAIPKREKYSPEANKIPKSVISRVLNIVELIKKIDFPINYKIYIDYRILYHDQWKDSIQHQ